MPFLGLSVYDGSKPRDDHANATERWGGEQRSVCAHVPRKGTQTRVNELNLWTSTLAGTPHGYFVLTLYSHDAGVCGQQGHRFGTKTERLEAHRRPQKSANGRAVCVRAPFQEVVDQG